MLSLDLLSRARRLDAHAAHLYPVIVNLLHCLDLLWRCGICSAVGAGVFDHLSGLENLRFWAGS